MGTLTAIFYDAAEKLLTRVELGGVRPDQLVELNRELTIPANAVRGELRIVQGDVDRGLLGSFALQSQTGGTR